MQNTCPAESPMGFELIYFMAAILIVPPFLFKGISLFGYRLIKPFFKSNLDVENERTDRKMQEFLELKISERICPICRDQTMLPIFTSCGHIFCCPCILRHWCHSTGMDTSLNCPNCRQEVPRLIPIADDDPFKDMICDGCSDHSDCEDSEDFDLSNAPELNDSKETASGDAQNRQDRRELQEEKTEDESGNDAEQAGDSSIGSSDGSASVGTSPLDDAMATAEKILDQLAVLKQSLNEESSSFLHYIDNYNERFGEQSWSSYFSLIGVSTLDRLFLNRKNAAFCILRLSILASIFNYLLYPFYKSSLLVVGAYASLLTYFGVACMSIFIELYLHMTYSHYVLHCHSIWR